MKLSDILKNVDHTTQTSLDPEITDLIYDSRKVKENTAFFCLKGYTSNGHDYAKSAVEKGAAALIISDDLDFEVPENVAVIKTEDTRLALALSSNEFFGNPADELMTVAITGTKGKTTTAAMIAEIFEHAGIMTGTIGTLGVVYGGNTYKTDNTTPESYEIQKSMRDMINAGCKAMVIEASSIGLKHSRLAGTTFDVGIFTNFSDDHIGGVEHADMDEYLYCKSLLFRKPLDGKPRMDNHILPYSGVIYKVHPNLPFHTHRFGDSFPAVDFDYFKWYCQTHLFPFQAGAAQSQPVRGSILHHCRIPFCGDRPQIHPPAGVSATFSSGKDSESCLRTAPHGSARNIRAPAGTVVQPF